MDEEGKAYSNLNTKTNWFSRQKFVILFSVLSFVLGSIATTLIVGSMKTPAPIVSKIAPTPTVITTDPRLLSDPSSILKKKVFGEWYGGFQAKVVSKTDKSFTIESGGDTLEIFMQDSITRLVDESSGKGFKVITLNELPINSVVRGSATISRGTLTNNTDQHVIANGVSIISK